MLNINAEDTLFISVAEKEKFENGEDCLHAFLVLCRRYEDGDIEVLQQLHYDQDRDEENLVTPFVISGIKYPTSFDDVSISPLQDGLTEDVLPVWNNILTYAAEIKHVNDYGLHKYTFSNDFRHSEDAYNCRSYAIVTLQNVGIEPTKAHFIGAAGISAIYKEFDLPDFDGEFHRASEGNRSTVEALKSRNRQLLDELSGEFFKPLSGHSCRIACPDTI